MFQTISEGFGIASDRAAIMSKNLTQLGYDLSSFFNISFTDSMQKLTSGISGELEPLRRLGYDLSQAKLKAVALSLGITKTFNSMTQAEKAQLRYYAIMTQVTVAQGDMARTLNAPANQLRIFSAQVTQAKRALGNIFIPILTKTLPYLIAFAKVVRLVANQIAGLFGFSLPEIDYSGVKKTNNMIADTAENLDDATKKAKKLKDALLGIDELNIISDNNTGAADKISDRIGGEFDFKLPEYDFLSGVVSTQVDEIVAKFKNWLGITDDIKTWSEFFDTNLGSILKVVGKIGAGFLAWKFAKGFINGLAWIQRLKRLNLSTPVTVTASAIVLITSFSVEWTALKDIIENGISKLNVGEAVGSSIAASLAGTFLGKAGADLLLNAGITAGAVESGMGTALAGALFGGGVAAVVAGVPMFVTGVYNSIVDGLSLLSGLLTDFGATLAGAGAGAIGAALGAWGGPIGVGIGAIVGVVVGALVNLGIYLYQNWEDVKAWAKNIGEELIKFATITIPAAFHTALSFLSTIPNKIRTGWDNVLKPIREFNWKSFGKIVGRKVGEFIKTIVKEFDESWSKNIERFFSITLPQFFADALRSIVDFHLDVLEATGTFFTETLPQAFVDVGKWYIDLGVSIVDGVVEGLVTSASSIYDTILGFVDGVKEALGIHSPSTVFRDKVGQFMGQGLLEGIAQPFKAIKTWVDNNLVSPIQQVVSGNPIEQGITLIKSGWDSVRNWIGNIPILSQGIDLVKTKWETVKGWIGNIPTLSQTIELVKQGWSTVKEWIGFIPVLSQSISLLKKEWTTVKEWIGNIPVLSQGISLLKSGWDNIKDWIGYHVVPTGISLVRDGWRSLEDWVGNKVSVGISLVKNGWDNIKSFFGLSSGGYDAGRGFKMFAGGGYISGNGKSGFWNSIPKFANGTANAGLHGSLFLAGEAGAEMVGHINGQTEVLNQSQIKLAMRSAVISGMAQFTEYWRSIYNRITAGSNAIIHSVMVNTDVLNAAIRQSGGYPATRQYSFESSDSQYMNHQAMSEEVIARIMREFYRNYVEPTLKEIAADTKRQADKEEQTVVRIGNRVVTEAVETQRRANGFAFTD